MNLSPCVLIALRDRTLAERLNSDLRNSGFSCQISDTEYDLFQSIEMRFFHVAIADVSLSNSSNAEILETIKYHSPNTEVIIVDESGSPELAVQAVGRDAFTYVTKPLLNSQYLGALIPKALERQQLRVQIDKKSNQIGSLLGTTEDIVSGIDDMKQLLRQVVRRGLVITGSEYGSISLLENNKVIMQESWNGIKWQDSPHSIGNEKLEGEKGVWQGGDARSSVGRETEEFVPLPWLGSYISVPVVDRTGDFIGILEIGNKKEMKFKQDDIHLIEGLARAAAIGIENVRLYEGIKVKSKELEDSERKYRTLVEKSPDLIFITQNNRFKYVNKEACRILSYTPQEFYALNVSDFTARDYREVFMENLRKITGGKDVPNYEVVMIRKDGGEVVLDVNSVTTEYEGKSAVQVIARDITDRIKAYEETLRLAAAVRSLNSAVTITDMNRRIIYINPAHRRVFGYDLGELVGKQSGILYPFDDPYGVSKKIYEAVLMVGWEGERAGVRKNGEVFPVYEKTSVVKDKDGKQIGVVSIVEDITLRKRLEQALRESEEQYRTLVETATSAIIATGENGTITLFNPAAEELFGYSKTDMEEKEEFSILIHDRYRDVYKAGLKGYLETGDSHLFGKIIELWGLRKGGEEFPIEVAFSVCKIGGRKIFTAIIFDITERKNLQDQLIQSEKMALVGQLVSSVTHEVNNPLAAVMGYAELFLGEPNLDEQLHKGLKVIYDESNRAKKEIQNLLSFARKHSPDRELTYINEILERTLNLKKYDFRKNNIEVAKNLGADLPVIWADPNQIQQVFLNILINAEQALTANQDDRQILIQTRVKEDGQGMINSEEDGIIEISFSDNGSGISKKNIKKIFDPFFTTKPVGKGTGLGLSVSYRIVKDHGGEIYALSEEDKGATFVIELPILRKIRSTIY